MTEENKTDLEFIEIYPKIVVYKNIFKDIEKTYSVLKESAQNNEDRFFSEWTQWSKFGEYLNPVVLNHPHKLDYDNVSSIETKTETEGLQKELLLEVLKGFNDVTKHYTQHFGVEIEEDVYVKDDQENDIPLWQWVGPSIAKYKDEIVDMVAMSYHSDYIWEPIISPGYKFAITALAYFNDDYEGGEIDFVIDKDLYKYKPEAGDYLVFPSGHPEILTKEGMVYLHGVLPPIGPNKYLSRMYWMKYTKGAPEWYEKEKEFGKEVWASMQPEIMENFRLTHPNRNEILDGVRIK